MAEHTRPCAICGSKSSSTMHFLPKNEDDRKKWLEFIYGTSQPAKYNKRLVLCSIHFQNSDFRNMGEYSRGFASVLLMRPGSVPSRRSAINSQESVQVKTEEGVQVKTEEGVQVKTEEDADSSIAPQPFLLKTVACQTERPVVSSVTTQLSMRTLGPKVRSKETQTPTLPVISLGNDTDLSMVKNKPTGPKQNQSLSLKSDKIGLHEEVTVQVSCLLQFFDRCLGCGGEACSLVTRREGAVFHVTQQCWICQFTVTWASHSQLAAVQNVPGDEEQEEEERDQDMEEEEEEDEEEDEEEEENKPKDTKRKRRDSDEDWAPDVDEFNREFVRQSSDDTGGSSCDEDDDGDGDDEHASELAWCCECRSKISNTCLEDKHPLLHCCVLCGYAEPHTDLAHRGTESTCDSEQPLGEASCTSTPGAEAGRSSGQQVDCSLQHVTNPGHLEEAGIGPEESTCTNDDHDQTDHIQPISATTEDPLSINNQSDATTEVPHSLSSQCGAITESPQNQSRDTSEGLHSMNSQSSATTELPHSINQPDATSEVPHSEGNHASSINGGIQNGVTGCELESAPSKPPFAVYFSDPYNLQSHMDQHHRSCSQRKLCPDCGKFFIKRNAAMEHDCEHKVKPFVCATCEKRFSTEAGLHTHQHVHREDYLVYCQFCFKGFRQTEDKVKHEESHKKERLKFYCPVCPKRFADRHSRSAHRKTHCTEDKFFCKYCDKGFKAMNNLRRHEFIHTGKKSFNCEVCDRSFNQSGHLKSHMRLHTGERPFKCQQCERSFNHNVSLKNHLQRHHGPKTDSSEQENQE